jgi:hypothetical protein
MIRAVFGGRRWTPRAVSAIFKGRFKGYPAVLAKPGDFRASPPDGYRGSDDRKVTNQTTREDQRCV